MNFSEKFSIEKGLIWIIVAVFLAVLVFVVYLFFFFGEKSIKVLTPNGGEELEIGKKYKISWTAKGVNQVGIALFSGKETSWIAKNIPAGQGSYEWEIYPGQGYGSNFWIAVFEYPWGVKNAIDYANSPFAITYAASDTCDSLSIQNDWLFLPSDFQNIRRVFITKREYDGNLGGLDKVNNICQKEAEDLKLTGNWLAFIGGDEDSQTAIKRLIDSPRGQSGIFVEAIPDSELERGVGCHRLIGRDFYDFLVKLSDPSYSNQLKLSEYFFNNISKAWLGRVSSQSAKSCIFIPTSANSNRPLLENYSFTATCQNWTQNAEFGQGYAYPYVSNGSFPNCYTPQGKTTEAVSWAGLSSGLANTSSGLFFTAFQGKSCNIKQKLICIEE